MNLNFFKMQAQGNDYIYCDLALNDGDFLEKNACYIAKDLSRRRFSVGSDGLVFIKKDNFADAKMIIYNADGTRAENCGNALRCIAYYLSDRLLKKRITVSTDSGCKTAEVVDDVVSVNLGKVGNLRVDEEKSYDKEIFKYIRSFDFYCFLSVGNPHLVLYNNHLKTFDNGLIGSLLVKNGGVNVEIVQKYEKDYSVTVFERGSGETSCCGTGAAAVYEALKRNNLVKNEKVNLRFKGGAVTLQEENGGVILSGKVKFCYEGVIKNYVIAQ